MEKSWSDLYDDAADESSEDVDEDGDKMDNVDDITAEFEYQEEDSDGT